MEKAKFEQVMTAYDNIAKEAETYVEMFSKPECKFEDLTLKQCKELVQQARTLEGRVDKILHNELYHLIGMGNLTSVQQSKLCAVIKRIGYARCFFRPVADYVINNFPKVPDKTAYKCELAGVKLDSIIQ